MCMAIPMQVAEVTGLRARCRARGAVREVSLWMLQHEGVQPGDHLLVHLDDAVRKVTEAEARETWDLLDLILAGPGQAAPPPEA